MDSIEYDYRRKKTSESVDKFIHYVILCFWLFFTGVMDVGVQEMWR